jgi:hypothetical protein
MMLNAGLNLAWPTQIYKTSIDAEICSQIANQVLSIEDVLKPQGDWTSNLIDQIPLFKEVATEKFASFFHDVYDFDINAVKFSLKAWLTGTTNGYYMPIHNHSGSQFVSVFYIMAEEESAGGEIVLQDPRVNANRGFMPPFINDFASIEHKPKTGDVLIFPAYVYHYVKPYTSRLRLAIPTDIFLNI